MAHDSSVGACLDPAWLGVIFLPESKDKGMQHSWESQNVLEHLDFLPVLGPVPFAPWAGYGPRYGALNAAFSSLVCVAERGSTGGYLGPPAAVWVL